MEFLAILGVFGFGLWLRARPVTGLSVDHWYWLAFVEKLKRDRRMPPDLPQYKLEDAQWYPPVFPLLLCLLPPTFLKKTNRWIAVAIDLARLALLFWTLHALGYGTPMTYAITGLIYITSPMLVVYNTQLNPRGLAALFLDGLLVFLMLRAGNTWTALDWSLALVLLGLVLLTHKMNTQLAFFNLLCAATWMGHWEYAALLPASILLATLLSGGFYLDVLKAHWDITSFWTKEWPLLGADALRESPLYGRKDYRGPVRQYEPGLGNFAKRFLSLFFGNYAPAAAATLFLMGWTIAPTPGWVLLKVWFVTTLIFAAITVLVPHLRGFGFGNLYLYNAVFPACLLVGLSLSQHRSIGLTFTAAAFGLNVIALIRSFKHVQSTSALLDESLLAEIRRCPPGSWLTFPYHVMDQLAYSAGKPVLWGGHAYGFRKLWNVFPVLRTDLTQLKRDFDLRFLLVSDSYLADVERITVRMEKLYSGSGYHIFEIRPSEGSPL